jgi:cytochrome c-type biogenesis protein CcmE
MRGQQQYYLHLDELERMAAEVDGKGVRVNARVEPGSIRKAPQRLVYDFAVTDGRRRVTVHYEGIVSDMFKDGIEVVVEGRYDARRNHIEATRLLTKCPSKYQADSTRP